jgi:hypothetical protein
MRIRSSVMAPVVVALLWFASPALAGPPLICFPFDIGAAKSLPMGRGGWRDVDSAYDIARLATDTLAILTPETPVIVRMETLRRAALYATARSSLGVTLLARLQERAAGASPAWSALFDVGYLVETYKQSNVISNDPVPGLAAIDGYAMVTRALTMHPDAGIEFAAAVITQGHVMLRAEHRGHLDRALTGAKGNPALLAVVTKHFRETGEL